MSLEIIPLRFGNNILKNKGLLYFYGKQTVCYGLNAANKYSLFDNICFTIISKKIKTKLFKVVEYLSNGHAVKSLFCKLSKYEF